ncbi:MAG: GtrA family protein [Gammaproteobacteria bacterium]|nr:GtrA family protein [Gammaproteobacteria bacterium]
MSEGRPPANMCRELGYVTRYAGSGFFNTILGFITIFSTMALGVSPLLSNVAGYVVGFFLGFVLSKRFVFMANGNFISESVRYLVAFMVAFLCNLTVLAVALEKFTVAPYLAQLGAAVIYTTLMYIFTRYFVFRVG